MTADQWLTFYKKQPFKNDSLFYWGSEVDSDPKDPDSEDMLLYDSFFQALQGKKTYPNVKAYASKEEAIEDFRQAFYKVTGFDPITGQ